MKTDESKSIGIKEIAQALGTSIGTVDRALHARPGVSPATRSRVLKMADKLGYRPNLFARNLKLNRRLRIAVHLPRTIASFFRPLRQGIEIAADAFRPQLELEFFTYERLAEGDLALFKEALKGKYDGFLITPGNPATIQPLIQKANDQKMPVICVASDAPHSGRIASVTVDAFISGSLAAELFSRVLPGVGHVAVLTGELSTLDHAEKVRGFAATLAMLAPHLTLLPVAEGHEDPKQAFEQTYKLFSQDPTPTGIYVNTANSLPVMQALQERGQIGKVKIITTDLFPAMVPLIESGAILTTLYQRPQTQGRLALEMLARYLLEGTSPSEKVRIAPHIVLRSNLPLFLDRISTISQDKFPAPQK